MQSVDRRADFGKDLRVANLSVQAEKDKYLSGKLPREGGKAVADPLRNGIIAKMARAVIGFT